MDVNEAIEIMWSGLSTADLRREIHRTNQLPLTQERQDDLVIMNRVLDGRTKSWTHNS